MIGTLIFFCQKFKSCKLNNFILCVSIISASTSSQKYYVSSLKDANNINLKGKSYIKYWEKNVLYYNLLKMFLNI